MKLDLLQAGEVYMYQEQGDYCPVHRAILLAVEPWSGGYRGYHKTYSKDRRTWELPVAMMRTNPEFQQFHRPKRNSWYLPQEFWPEGLYDKPNAELTEADKWAIWTAYHTHDLEPGEEVYVPEPPQFDTEWYPSTASYRYLRMPWDDWVVDQRNEEEAQRIRKLEAEIRDAQRMVEQKLQEAHELKVAQALRATGVTYAIEHVWPEWRRRGQSLDMHPLKVAQRMDDRWTDPGTPSLSMGVVEMAKLAGAFNDVARQAHALGLTGQTMGSADVAKMLVSFWRSQLTPDNDEE